MNKLTSFTPLHGEEVFIATTSGPIVNAGSANRPMMRGLVVIDSPDALELILTTPCAGPHNKGGNDGYEIKVLVVTATPGVTHTIRLTKLEELLRESKPGQQTLSISGAAAGVTTLTAFGGQWFAS